MKHILFCPSCKRYTLMGSCPDCKGGTVIPRPAKFSPDDKYASYRRRAKEEDRKDKGLLG